MNAQQSKSMHMIDIWLTTKISKRRWNTYSIGSLVENSTIDINDGSDADAIDWFHAFTIFRGHFFPIDIDFGCKRDESRGNPNGVAHFISTGIVGIKNGRHAWTLVLVFRAALAALAATVVRVAVVVGTTKRDTTAFLFGSFLKKDSTHQIGILAVSLDDETQVGGEATMFLIVTGGVHRWILFRTTHHAHDILRKFTNHGTTILLTRVPRWRIVLVEDNIVAAQTEGIVVETVNDLPGEMNVQRTDACWLERESGIMNACIHAIRHNAERPKTNT